LIEYVEKIPNTLEFEVCAITTAKSRPARAGSGLSPEHQTRYELINLVIKER
jgi:hypothetical protein